MGATRKHRRTRIPPKPRLEPAHESYPGFVKLDGRHGYKDAVPAGYVDYQVRTRRGGRVSYFNFDLAIEMGLIPADHPHRLTKELRKTIVDTFAIQIINEYDMIHGTKVPKQDIKPHRHMATRYLQLQHPDKNGTTSGDGRSVWNGEVSAKGVTWDVSSCGTGATCLSPATAIEKKFFRTGDPRVCYGCGNADLDSGISAAIFSEILHRRGVPTERTLAVIGFGRGQAINVRAGRNLLRPSHFFLYLRQGHYGSLKAAVDFFIDRQIANGEEGYVAAGRHRYAAFAERMAITFARSAAIFESDYLFVWMDWDGDNILADGGIIDYGSVRQFGLFHHEYRYDDYDRYSTSIIEQRAKARGMVQTFAQLRDYLHSGEKKNRNAFADDQVLKLFDRTFEETLLSLLLEKIGFEKAQCVYLMRYHRDAVEQFREVHAGFERAKAKRGPYKVLDGVTWDAIYCMRDVLRELPKKLLSETGRPTPAEFMTIMASSFATRADRVIKGKKSRRIQTYMKLYEDLIGHVAKHDRQTPKRVLLKVVMRSGQINRADRVTGNSILLMADRLAKADARLSQDDLQGLIEAVIGQQITNPERAAEAITEVRGGKETKTLVKTCLRLIKVHKDGL